MHAQDNRLDRQQEQPRMGLCLCTCKNEPRTRPSPYLDSSCEGGDDVSAGGSLAGILAELLHSLDLVQLLE